MGEVAASQMGWKILKSKEPCRVGTMSIEEREKAHKQFTEALGSRGWKDWKKRGTDVVGRQLHGHGDIYSPKK